MQLLKTSYVLVLLFLCVHALSACSALGVRAPTTLDQRLAYAEGQVTAGYQSVADLANRKRISQTTGLDLITKLDTASKSLKAARIAVGQGNIQDANAALAAATQVLLVVEASLKEASK